MSTRTHQDASGQTTLSGWSHQEQDAPLCNRGRPRPDADRTETGLQPDRFKASGCERSKHRPKRFVVTLEFESIPTDLAGIKRLLRSFGARCLACRPAPAELEPNPDGEYSYRFASTAEAGRQQ